MYFFCENIGIRGLCILFGENIYEGGDVFLW